MVIGILYLAWVLQHDFIISYKLVYTLPLDRKENMRRMLTVNCKLKGFYLWN